MMDSCIRMILDLRETDTPVTVKAKRGDTGRALRIKLSDGSSNYPIEEDCYAVFTGKKPDDTVIYNRCSLEDGEIVYAFTEQTCTVAGQIPAEIRLYGSQGKLLTSASFILDVEDTVFGEDDVISQGEMNVLDALVTETKALKQEIEEKLASGAFRGEPGPPGVDGTVAFDALTEEQKASLKGADGTVSFDELTEQQRLSLKGEPGDPGKPGEPGQPGEPGKAGNPGKSAYAYAVEGGFAGTEAEFAHKLAEDALLTAGGTMKGSVSMGGNALTGLPAPQAEDHAASKAYVDEVAASHTENAENPHGVTAQQVGARPDDWMPTAAQVGAATPEAVKEAVRKAAPRNLLDNSDWRVKERIVNQRNFTGGAVHAWEYFADRWRGAADGANVTLENNGIRLNSGCICENILDLSLSGRTFTFAVCEDDDTITLMTFKPTLGTYTHIEGNESNKLKLAVGVGGENNNVLYMYIFSKNVTTIRWAALYEGEYTIDTFPEYQSKGYSAELDECQRYYITFGKDDGSYTDLAVGYCDGNTATFVLPLRMRDGSPDVIIPLSNIQVGNPVAGSYAAPTSIYTSNLGNAIRVTCAVQVTAGAVALRVSDDSVGFVLDNNL